VIAQMGAPDMRTPIACALAYPDRMESGADALDFTTLGNLSFERVDAAKFPCVALAREAIRQGGTAPAALNAANEIAVEAFLGGRLGFTQIAQVIESVLGESNVETLVTLEQVYAADNEARALAARYVSRLVPRASSVIQ
jgi:1-deoxy-D-xylulose-5-phosphate reductoisomerase